MDLLQRRQLLERVIPQCVANEFTGVGSGRGDFGPKLKTFLNKAKSNSDVLTPTLLIRPKCNSKYWAKVPNWKTDGALNKCKFNKAVNAVKSYDKSTVVKQQKERYTELQEEHINHVHSFVPPHLVPDRWSISQSKHVPARSHEAIYGKKRAAHPPETMTQAKLRDECIRWGIDITPSDTACKRVHARIITLKKKGEIDTIDWSLLRPAIVQTRPQYSQIG